MRIRLLIVALLFGLTASAQINDTATLRNYINTNIVPNGTRSVTAAQLNYSLTGLLNVLQKYKVDTLYVNATGDSLVFISSKVRRAIKFSSGAASSDGSKYVGTIYDKSTWTDLSDFASNTLGATVSGGKIQIPNAGVSDFTKSLQLASYSCINHWKAELIFKLTTPISGSTTGISLGINSTNANSLNSWAVYFSTSTTNTGRMEFFAQSNSGSWFSADAANSSLSFVQGDSIKLSIERENNTVYLYAENLTDHSQAASMYTIATATNANPIAPNTGHFSIWGQGGTFEVQRFAVYNKEIKNPDVLFLGDSKTQGYGADNFYSTYPGILGVKYKNVAISAGFGDKTSDMLNHIPEVISIHPKNVVLSVGSNDQRFGVSQATFQANYASIVQQLKDSGINVFHISPAYETAQNLLTQYAYVKSNYPHVIDVFNVFKDASVRYSDGIHWSNKGNAIVAKLILDSNYIPAVKTVNEYINLTGRPISSVTGLQDTLNARKDSSFWTRIYNSVRTKNITDSVGVGKKATQNFDVAGKSNFDDTTRMHSLLIGGAQPAIPSVYRFYSYGNAAFTGTTTWNGGTYSSRNNITISNKIISPWSAYTSTSISDITNVATIGFYRFQASGLGKAAYHDYFGRIFFGSYSGSGLNSGQNVGAEWRVQAAQVWDTTKRGTRMDFLTTKKGAIPVVDSATLAPKTALLLEDNQNIGIGINAVNDSAYSGRLQIRNDSALGATQPLIYAETYDKTFRWGVMANGDMKSPVLYSQVATTADNMLYVAADGTVKKGVVPVGTAPPVVDIIIPSDVYAVEGAEFNIYNDNITLATYGKSDFRYDYVCSKGIQYNDRFSFTPLQADSGTYSLAINVYYKYGLIASKTVSLHSTTRRAGSGTRNVIMGGDSQVAAGTITDTAKVNYSADVMTINYLGTQSTAGGNFMEARGGWTWADFTTTGRTFYKLIVTGITVPPSLGATYTNNSSTFAVREINLSGGSGYISYERTAGSNTPSSSGTMTKSTGTGDATITFSSFSTVPGNPLWNGTLSRMDVAGYFTNNSITLSSGDWFTMQLGTNDIFGYADTVALNSKISAILISVDTFINAVHAVSSGINIAIVLPSPPGDQDAAGSNYTAGQTSWWFDLNVKKYMKAIIAKYDNSTYKANAVYVLGANAQIDTRNNMQTSAQKYNARNYSTYPRQINLVHPANSGYAQYSDAYYGFFKWYK